VATSPNASELLHRRRPSRRRLGRLGDPVELGKLVAFLASQQASYITGGVYQVDGGSIKSHV
jgi:NAD(P)-dependent dehydrogenase (short-subunit alcohol dehydrogenase family)